MNFLKGIADGLKAMTWNGPHGRLVMGGYNGHWGFRSEEDSAPEWTNSAVWAVLNFVINTFPEAPPMLEEQNEEKQWEEQAAHPITQLLKSPNKFFNGSSNFVGAVTSKLMSGGGHWIIRKDGLDYPEELWYWPHWAIAPVYDAKQPDEFIAYWRYWANGQQNVLPNDRVIYFRHGVDPEDMKLGMSPMKAIFRERMTDDEASMAAYYMMKHGGNKIPFISPKDPRTTIKEPEGKVIAQQWLDRSTGDRRGQPMIPSMPVDVNYVGSTPKDMVLDKVRAIPVSRICAAMGLDPMVVGLPSENKTYANYKEAREAAYESFIIPMQRSIVEELNNTLLPMMGKPSKQRIAFDYRQVRVLQEDFDKLAVSTANLYEKQIIDRKTAKQMLSLKWDSSDEGVYYIVKVSQSRLNENVDLTPPTDGKTQINPAPTPAMKELGL